MRYQKRDNIIYARFGKDGLAPTEQTRGKKGHKRNSKNWLEAIVADNMDNAKYQRAVADFRAQRIISFEPEPFYAEFALQGSQLEPFHIGIAFAAREDLQLSPAQAAALKAGKIIPTHWHCTCPDDSAMCRHVGTALMYLHEKLDIDSHIEDILRDIHHRPEVIAPVLADFWEGAALPPIPELAPKNIFAHTDPKKLGAILRLVTDSAVESLQLKGEIEEIYNRVMEN